MNIRTILKFTAVIGASIIVTACSTPALYKQTSDSVDKEKTNIDKISATQEAAIADHSAVVVEKGMYIDDNQIDLRKQPEWLSHTISLHGDQLPFSFYSRSIVQNNHVLTLYQQGLDPAVMVNMNYSGTVKGALDSLAAKTGYVYSVNGDKIYWQAFVTHTFSVAFMPGSSDYMVGKNSNSGQVQSGTGTAGSNGSPTSESNGADSQYSNLAGKISVWDDLQKTITSMLSKDGKVIISQSTTTITVTDHPDRVKEIGAYIKKINHYLSQEVMLKVQVLQVDLDSSFMNGVNWDLVTNFIGKSRFRFNGNFSQPISISPLSTLGKGIGFSNAEDTSSVLFNALSQQGKVSVSTEPTVVTTNDQVASINITTTNGYLAQIQNTSSPAQQSGNQTTTSLTPGQVTTGLTLYVLPKVMDDKVYLQLSSDLSTLVQIRSLSNQPSGGANAETIQVPDIDEKAFNQRSVVGSGATLILAGFKQMKNETGAEQFLNSQALGGKGARQEDQETIVLITPYILNNNADNNG